MHMKFILKISLGIISLLLINCLPANAQYPRKRMTADFRMGINYLGMSGVDSEPNGNPGVDQNFTTGAGDKFKMGLHIGANVNYKIIGNFQIQTGFYVTKKGYKTHEKESKMSEDGIQSVYDIWNEGTGNYIQMPFNIGYELYVSKKVAFNINGGLYGAYGYGNKGRIKKDIFVTTYKPNVPPTSGQSGDSYEVFTFSDTKWKRFDYGLNGSVGFIYDIYTINFNYEHGLLNVTQEINQNIKHRIYSLSLGFRF